MVSALLYIAEAKRFFSQYGLDAKFETATNAKICQDMLLARKADYMTGPESAITYLASSNPPVRILAMMQQNPETSVFARRDSGITKFEDLKNKRVAYLPGTTSYFFLGRILKHYNIKRADLKLTAMQPPTMPAALIGGSIDAFSMWEPWGTHAALQMPDNIINLSNPDLYKYESLLTGHMDAIKQNPEIPSKILRALIDAETFIKDKNDEAFSLLSKAIVFEEKAFKNMWPQYLHKVRLENKPIELLKENFSLLQEDDPNFKDIVMPDFRSFVEPLFLRQIAPDRVRID